MKQIAIITARGGSKRIPRKNIKDFCGKPMLAWAVEAALSSGCFDTVMVSTEDEEIAAVAKQYGAEVPFLRSTKTADDYSTTSDVLLEVLSQYETDGQCFDTACCIYPTAPFVTAALLRDALRRFAESDADTLLPVVRFSSPVQRAYVEQDGLLVMAHPEHRDTRSQDLTPHFHDAGQFYVFRPKRLKERGTLLTGNILPLELPEARVQDIDTEEDWVLAEMKFRLSGQTADAESFPGLSLRDAVMTDAPLLYAWRNDPETKQASFQTGDFSYEHHLQWLENRLKTPGLYILMCDAVPAGTMRVDVRDGAAHLSYSIDPAHRKRGFSVPMLFLTEKKVASDFCDDVGVLVASVRPENAASRRMLTNAGYTPTEKEDVIEYRKALCRTEESHE